MAVSTKAEKPNSLGAAGRRSSRLPIAIPVTISGKDSTGKAFKENTRTVIVNRHGAKILTVHQLALGAELTVENRSLGQVARANVVWLGEKRTPKDPCEFGIQLLDAQNIWGIEFPPEDWQEGQPPIPGMKPPNNVAAPAPAPAAKAAEEPTLPKGIPKLDTPKPLAAPPSPPALAPTPRPATAVSAPPAPAPRPAPAAAAPAPPAAEVPGERLAGFNAQLEEACNVQAKQFEQRLANLIRQIGQQSQISLQDSANAVQEKVSATLEEQVNALGARLEKARGEMESLLAKLGEVQQKAQEEVTKSLRTIQETGAEAIQYAVEDLTERARKELESSSGEMLDQVRKKFEEARAGKLDAISKEVGDRLEALSKDFLATAQRDFQAQIAQAAQSAGAKAADEILASVRAQVEKDLRKSAGEAAAGTVKELQKTAEELLESSSKELQKQADDTVELLTEELKATGKKLFADTEKQLASKPAAALEDFATKLAKMAKEAQEKNLRELETQLEKGVDKSRDAAIKHVQKAVEESGEQALVKFKAKIDPVAKEITDNVNRQVGSSAAVLKDWEDQAKTRVESHFQKIEQNAKSAALAAARDVEKDIKQDIRGLEEKGLETLQTKLQKLIDDFVESSALQLNKLVADNVDLFGEQLKEKQERAANDAAEAFRSKIAEILAVFQPGGKK